MSFALIFLCTSLSSLLFSLFSSSLSLSLFQPSTSLAVATSAARSHIELIRAAPRWEGLDAALAATSYGDDDHEAESAENENAENGNAGGGNDNGARKSSGVFSAPAAKKRGKKSDFLLTFPQLLQRVQASESELRAELGARGAFAWNRRRSSSGEEGGDASEREAKRSRDDPSSSSAPFPSSSSPLPAIRVLEPSFAASMLDFLLLTAAGRGWRLHALPTEDLVKAMTSTRAFDENTGELGGGYDEGILKHALWRWSSRRTEGGRSGMRASDDGGGGGGGVSPPSGGGGGGGGETPGTAPRASQRQKPSFSSAPAPLFDEMLHEASAEAFSGPRDEDAAAGGGNRQERRGGGGAGSRRQPLPALLALDEATVLRHEARKLLQASPTWSERAFSAAWREALARLGVEVARPAVALDLAAATSGGGGGGALAGLATLLPPPLPSQHQQKNQNQKAERTVLRLDASALPRDPRSRFAALFPAKPRWRKEEIAPYLLGVAVAPGIPGGMGALLLAHARASQSEPDAPVFFSAR